MDGEIMKDVFNVETKNIGLEIAQKSTKCSTDSDWRLTRGTKGESKTHTHTHAMNISLIKHAHTCNEHQLKLMNMTIDLITVKNEQITLPDT